MCGIAGVYDTGGNPVDSTVIARMAASIAHRGPDGEGVHVHGHVGLGHRRLAIIDLSDAAEQPMFNEDGSIAIVFNGEIYNYLALRTELIHSGHDFHSNSDTEVIIHGYEEWGSGVVSHLDGMFAFALWDARADQVLLARDRFGIKPLYYAFDRGRFFFASEVKAILEAGAWNRTVDRQALVEYFTFQNILSDRTLFAGVRLLRAGHLAVVGRGADGLHSRPWWDARFENKLAGVTFEDASRELNGLVSAAVRRQLMSDVPLGSYLSGGMDSGSIVAIAGRSIPHLMTFTGGFELSLAQGIEQNFDERDMAERMASMFGTDHYEMVLHAGSMERVLPKLVWHLEDLRVGMSYQNYYIAQLTSRFVRVVLSGGGGDELFGGYPWRYAPLLAVSDRSGFDTASFHMWERLVPSSEHEPFFDPAVLEEAGIGLPRAVFDEVLSEAPGTECGWSPGVALDREMYLEAKTFLHGLLVVEDKLSSAHALEARVPFLDNAVVDFMLALPGEFKVNMPALLAAAREHDGPVTLRSGDGKRILRHAMKGVLPDEVLDREKQGFSTPDASWYRQRSHGYISDLVLSDRARSRRFFRPEAVRRIVDEHVSGEANHRLLLWSLMSFEWWNRLFIDGDAVLDS